MLYFKCLKEWSAHSLDQPPATTIGESNDDHGYTGP